MKLLTPGVIGRVLCAFVLALTVSSCSDESDQGTGQVEANNGNNDQNNGNNVGNNGNNDNNDNNDIPPVVDPDCPEGCDDGISCTVDECDGERGCVHTAQSRLCIDDGNACTTERCDPVQGCVSDTDDNLCDDGVDCTVDSCDEQGGCVHNPSDSNCSDGISCTADRCDAIQGCIHTGNDEACNDNVGCTTDTCEPGEGCVHTPNNGVCNDGIPCTADICDVESDCVNRADHARCDDNNTCTSNRCDIQTRSCTSGPRDEDNDGEVDLACGGTDCLDSNQYVGQNADEVCNGTDDDCDGEIDEGVVSPCGNCDSSCFQADFGVEDDDTLFPEEGMFGVAVDEDRGGLVAESFARRFNFLWVTNTGESTVSRWDADTATEIGRYKVGLPEGECLGVCCWSSRCNMPSRVGVDGRGDAYIASRGFGMQGTVTKVAASAEDCIDRNNNGMIDTSIDATPMGFDEDECVLWTVPVGPSNAVLRGLAVDLGDDNRPEGYVWAGGYNERKWWKIDPRDGAVLAEVAVPVSPYGGVVTADGKLWTGILSGDGTAYVDTNTNTSSPLISFPTALRNNCRGSYGITADGNGRVWFTGWNCRDSMGYDPELDAWTRVDTTAYGHSAGRGMTVDSNNRLWMAMEGGGRSHIVTWLSDDFVPNGVIPQAQTELFTTPPGHTGPSGVGADANGMIWLAHHQSSQLVRFNPVTEIFESFTGPNRVYTYSDFTGGVRRTITGEGLYQLDFEAECDRPDWDELSWEADTPEGTRIVINGATAPTDPGLQMAQVVPFAILPGDTSPINVNEVLRAQGEIPQKHLRVSFNLEVSDEAVSPVLRSFNLRWFCK